MNEDKPIGPEEEGLEKEPVKKDRSLLYMGLTLGLIIFVMGYITLFVEDPSKLFDSKDEIKLVTDNGSSVLKENESMDNEQVRKSLIQFIEAFYADQRRGYFDPPSYFADITETFYIYHNLTHKRLKEIYWKRMEDRENLRRNWIVSSLDFDRIDSRIIATYFAQESYLRPSLREKYSALIKYELIINENGKIVSLREAEVKNEERQKLMPDSMMFHENIDPPVDPGPEAESDANNVYDSGLVEVAPEFPGGQKDLVKYVGSSIRYPANARQNNIQGKVYISFIVEKDGQLTDFTIKQGIGGGCDEEALRVMRNSPKWKPGLINENPVRTFYVLPITFQLN